MSVRHTPLTNLENNEGYDVSRDAWNAPHVFSDGAVYEVVPYNGKIADITHADVLHHFLDLAAALGETRDIAVITFHTIRIAGTGDFVTYPNEGIYAQYSTTWGFLDNTVTLAAGLNRIEYNLTVANDDWDFICLGYMVEGA